MRSSLIMRWNLTHWWFLPHLYRLRPVLLIMVAIITITTWGTRIRITHLTVVIKPDDNNNNSVCNLINVPLMDINESVNFVGFMAIVQERAHSFNILVAHKTNTSSHLTILTLHQPWANVVTVPSPTQQYNAANWLLDSGATHHITSDLNNLSLHQPYNSGDEVLIGDGSGLTISHTCSTFLPLSTRPLALNQILCVPHIHKKWSLFIDYVTLIVCLWSFSLLIFRWNISARGPVTPRQD